MRSDARGMRFAMNSLLFSDGALGAVIEEALVPILA
jgi:hypothetical protein